VELNVKGILWGNETMMMPRNREQLDNYWAETRKMIDEMLNRHGIGKVPCGVSIGPGWLPAVDEALGKLVEAGWDKQLGQVKQKFAQLRIYLDGKHEEKFNAIILEAEDRCDKLCEACGKERQKKGMRAGWALCDECGTEEKR
jgi:hypothetical protein